MLAADNDIREILSTLERVQSVLDDLVVRGLRTVDPEQIKSLDVMQEQFQRMGAGHLAARLKSLADALRNDDKSAAPAVMNAQASVRMYERLLTLENATAALQAFIEMPKDADGDETGDEEEADEDEDGNDGDDEDDDE
jgi:hypothetical protein